MNQRIKVLEAQSADELEYKINKFLDQYEARGIQMTTTHMSNEYIQPVWYSAIIKYQLLENESKSGGTAE
jgi:hypothetical protein